METLRSSGRVESHRLQQGVAKGLPPLEEEEEATRLSSSRVAMVQCLLLHYLCLSCEEGVV